MRFNAHLVDHTPRRLVAAAWLRRFFWLYICKVRCHVYLHAIFQEDWPKKKLKNFYLKICCILFRSHCSTFYFRQNRDLNNYFYLGAISSYIVFSIFTIITFPFSSTRFLSYFGKWGQAQFFFLGYLPRGKDGYRAVCQGKVHFCFLGPPSRDFDLSLFSLSIPFSLLIIGVKWSEKDRLRISVRSFLRPRIVESTQSRCRKLRSFFFSLSKSSVNVRNRIL